MYIHVRRQHYFPSNLESTCVCTGPRACKYMYTCIHVRGIISLRNWSGQFGAPLWSQTITLVDTTMAVHCTTINLLSYEQQLLAVYWSLALVKDKESPYSQDYAYVYTCMHGSIWMKLGAPLWTKTIKPLDITITELYDLMDCNYKQKGSWGGDNELNYLIKFLSFLTTRVCVIK